MQISFGSVDFFEMCSVRFFSYITALVTLNIVKILKITSILCQSVYKRFPVAGIN